MLCPRSHESSSNRPRRNRAFTLIDLMVAMAVFGMLAALATPSFQRMHDGLELRLAAEEVAGVMRQARQHAITHNVHVGVKFTTDEETGFVYMHLYRDGDGDGVRNHDIDSGDDKPVSVPQPLAHVGQRVHFGFPSGPMPRNVGGHGTLTGRDDPIRFNQSDIASFGPLGTATPGTVYLTDGSLRVAAVRISSRSGRLHLYFWNRDQGVWR